MRIARTTAGGSTTMRRRAPEDPRGAALHEVALGEPEPDRVEAALGSGRAEIVVADLRPPRGSGAGPRRIRLMDGWTSPRGSTWWRGCRGRRVPYRTDRAA